MAVLSVTYRLSGRIAIVVNTAATEKNNRDAQEAIMNKESIILTFANRGATMSAIQATARP
jgi:hypothetical protein